jgi:hypothetical protein
MTSRMQGRRSGGLVAVAAGGWIALSAQGCKPSMPAQIRYRVVIRDADAVRGVAVMRQGQRVGALSAAGDVEFSTPSSVRPSTLGLSLALPTPCGTRSVALDLPLTSDADSDRRIAEAMARERVVLLRGSLSASAGVGSSVVLLDRGADTREVRVGEAVITAPTRATLFVGECGPSAPVRVGDEVIGTWHVGSAATFVSLEPVCHRLTTLGYGDAVTGLPVVFRQRVRALQQIPEHVLRAAPRSVRGGRYEGARYVRELVRTECPAGPPPAEVATRAMAQGGCLQAMPSLRRAVDDDQDDIASAVQFAVCSARNTEREGVEVARRTIAIHPEARERFVQAFTEAGLTGPAGAL